MIASKEDLREYVAEDMRMHAAPGWQPKMRITNRPAYFQWLLRRSEYWANCRRDPVGRVVAACLAVRVRLLGERLGFTIPRNVSGPGLSLAHVGTVVVNSQARIGRNCRIHQGVTLGEADGAAPTIGDSVFLGPNVTVLGGVHVGDGSGVKAGAVVVKDLPERSEAGGVPATVQRIRASGTWHDYLDAP